MSLQDEVQMIELELSIEMIEALTSRAEPLGLTAEEYAECVIWKHEVDNKVS